MRAIEEYAARGRNPVSSKMVSGPRRQAAVLLTDSGSTMLFADQHDVNAKPVSAEMAVAMNIAKLTVAAPPAPAGSDATRTLARHVRK